MQDDYAKMKSDHRDRNPHVLKLIEEKAKCATEIRGIENVFYIKQDSIERLEDLLISIGFKISSKFESAYEDKDVSSSWCLEAYLELIPTIGSLNSMTDKCVELAISSGAEYDGWYTEI